MPWKKKPQERSIRSNGAAIKKERDRLGYTQEELSAVSGLSIRVIAKAESSAGVHPDTIEVLAASLSTAKRTVFPEDLVSWPKHIVRHIIESFAKHERQCVAHCHQHIHEDFVVSAPGDPELFAFAGVRHSIDGFDDFWGQYFKSMERHDKLRILNSLRLVEEDNLVVALVEEAATIKGFKGPAIAAPLTFIFEFKEGKVIRFDDHFDVTQARRDIEAQLAKRREA